MRFCCQRSAIFDGLTASSPSAPSSRRTFLARAALATTATSGIARNVLAASPAADIVFRNGVIRTMTAAHGPTGQATAEALAIKAGRILATGSSAEMSALADDATRIIDLQGRTVLPGLIDPHHHSVLAALCTLLLLDVGFSRCRTRADALTMLRAAAAKAPPGQWIAAGFYDNVLQGGHLSGAELDAVSDTHPIFVMYVNGHVGAANALAFARVGITADVDTITGGGRIGRGLDGKHDGLIYEQPALLRFTGVAVPPPTEHVIADDLSRMSRNTVESLRLDELANETEVRVIGASDGFDSTNPQSSLLLPVLGSMNEAFITQLRAKVKRGMDDAFQRGDNIQPPGVGYRMVEVKDAEGNLVITHKGTIEKIVKLPEKDWVWREVPQLRILSDELATAVRAKLGLGGESFGRRAKDPAKMARRVDLYPKVLIRPICGGCRHPMSLGRSTGKYRAFACLNATTGIKGCTNRGYKSDRIIDEAVLGTVMATLFTEGFIADLTADVNARLAELARRPIPSTKKLEQEIANEDRQLKRLTDRLAKVDETHLDAVIAKAEEMGRQLAAKREQLKELQRAGRRPKVKSVRDAGRGGGARSPSRTAARRRGRCRPGAEGTRGGRRHRAAAGRGPDEAADGCPVHDQRDPCPGRA